MRFSTGSYAVPDESSAAARPVVVKPIRAKSWALKILREAVRKFIYRKLARCSPEAFFASCPQRPKQPPAAADYGHIQFSGGGVKVPARWMHLADSRAPYRTAKRYASDVLDLMEKHWDMSPASVLISITGGAQDFVLPPRLNKAFRHGLAKAAQATNAWVFTGGTDSGVMQLVGQAIAEYNVSCACIGVVTWGVVLGRDHLRGLRGETAELAQATTNSAAGANLEPNHTHLLLVDSGKEDATAWGGEIAFRFELEKEYCLRRKVPRVLLVVQGGPGTLASILAAIEGESPVVLVRDSGGVATLLDHFLNTYKDEGSPFYQKGEIMAAFEKSYGPKRDVLTMIAQLDSRAHKVSSFGLTENSTAELDLHLLNAVINDETQVLPEKRLRLAVEWNRKDVVERVLRGLRSTTNEEKASAERALSGALQCALELRAAAMAQHDGGRVQIIKLLVVQNPGIVSKLDFLALYRSESRIFLDSSKLWQALVSDEALRADGSPTPIAVYRSVLLPFLEPLVPGMAERLSSATRLSFSDLLIWAVCVGDLPMAECFWHQCQRRGDPVRMALLAAQVSQRISLISQTEASKYEANAVQLEQWACSVLDKCRARHDAMLVLMRPSKYWPGTILRLAIDGENKNFVGHRYVQMIVDECWRGNSFGSLYALPQETSTSTILLHLLFPQVDMEPLGDVHSAAQISPAFSSKHTPAHMERGWSNLRRISFARVRNNQLLMESGGGRCESFFRGLRRCVMRMVQPQSEEGFLHFFKVPRVKFTLKLFSYVLFLALYFSVLSQRGEYAVDDGTGDKQRASGGPHLAFTPLDACFYAWAVALWLEEMHQWAVDSARGMSHVADLINIIDVLSLFALLLALALRLLALGLCTGFDEDAPSAAPAGGVAAAPDALLSAGAALGRQLRGSSGDGRAEVEPVWEETYHGCELLYASQLVVSLNAIPCFIRLINYLTVWRSLGVLYVILVQVAENVAMWLTLFAILLVGFSAASLGLMPSLGGGAFGSPSGAFFLPWWAMYGEFGELSEVSAAGSAAGTCVLWTWAFSSQVLLVNILIAMMTETYEKVKKNADNEWRYTRISLVDEFAGTVYDVPSPISMPFLLLDFGRLVGAKLQRSACYQCLRRACAMCGGGGGDGGGDRDADGGGGGGGGGGAWARAWSALPPRVSAWSPREHVVRDLLTSSLTEEDLAAIPQPYPDRIMQADLLEEQELSAKGGLTNQLLEQQDALDKVLAKELENQEIIMHIDKLQTKHAEQLGALEASLRTAHAREQALVRERELLHAALHVKARAKHPAYPQRCAVPDDKVSWRVRWPEYAPVAFTHAAVHANNRLIKPGGWADPPDCALLRREWRTRVSFESDWCFDPEGRPLNPRGRTGMCERGLLGKWGANQAADPIVTRLQPGTARLQVVAVLRKDTGDWALPGGMVDAGETVSAAVRREFAEEVGAIEDEHERRKFSEMVDELFVTGQVVYRGYVDDPRNTDNAWMETTAFHFHCNAELGANFHFNPDDDEVAAVRWLDVDPRDQDYRNLYASHMEWVDKVAAGLRDQGVGRGSEHGMPGSH